MENQDTQKIIRLLEAQGKVLEEHGKKFNEHEELLHFICETMGTFITKEDAKAFATKDDLKAFATKEDLKTLKQEMEDRFDSVDNQLSGIKVELTGIRKELDDIKLSLKKLEKKTQEDDDAMISEIEKLKQRVAVLERQLKVQMQPA